MTTQSIHDAVRTGRITPEDGARLLELHEDIERALKRQRRLAVFVRWPERLRRWCSWPRRVGR